MKELIESVPLIQFFAGLGWESIGKALLTLAIVIIWLNSRSTKKEAKQVADAVAKELADCRKERKTDNTHILKLVQITSESFGVIRAVTGSKRKPPFELIDLELRAKVLLAAVIQSNGVPAKS